MLYLLGYWKWCLEEDEESLETNEKILEEDKELEIKVGQKEVQNAIVEQDNLIHFSKCNCQIR